MFHCCLKCAQLLFTIKPPWPQHCIFHQQEICNKHQYKSLYVWIGFRWTWAINVNTQAGRIVFLWKFSFKNAIYCSSWKSTHFLAKLKDWASVGNLHLSVRRFFQRLTPVSLLHTKQCRYSNVVCMLPQTVLITLITATSRTLDHQGHR